MTLGKMKKRSLRLLVLLVVVLAALIIRIGYWQLVRGNEMKDAVLRQQTGETAINASRGTIYDRNHKVLAESATVSAWVPQVICGRTKADSVWKTSA